MADGEVSPPPDPPDEEPVELSASASHNNVLTGADNLLQALDGWPETRWSTFQPQTPGMWFELDLGQVQAISQVCLNNEPSPHDYPRGYIVCVSEDRAQWEEVARNDHNDRPLDITFSPRQARYIRVEQTGQADQWWWSIHQVTIKG